MALILKDRIKEGTTTTGTGDIVLGGAAATFDPFSSYLTNGDTTYYAVVHTSSGVDEWEVGLGTYDQTANAIVRTTVLSGSAGTSAVNFSAGTKDIFMTYPAQVAAYTDGSGDLSSDVGLGNHSTTELVEGSNLYYTDARVDAYLSGGTGVTYSAGTISIGQDVSTTADVTFNSVETTDGLTVGGNAVITGNLTVNGTTTTVNAENLAIADNLVYLNEGSSITNPDLGWSGNYNDGTYAHAGVFRDATDGTFKFFDGYVPEPDEVGIDPTHATYNDADIKFGTGYGNVTGNLTGNVTGNVTGNTAGTHTGAVVGNITGDLTGNADTATALETARTIQLTGDVTGSVSFDGTANAVITATVVDDSHAHVISNVDGLQAALDAKADDSTTITAGTGLTGGGSIGVNRTLSFDSTYGDGRYYTQTAADSRFANVTGDTFTGDVTVPNLITSGTVDGRDVSADGAKLDNIEAGATADQTAGEIKTLYESNSNTNAFTDTLLSKLNGIESGATGNQTASEILTAIKTVDGSGSGLDADLLDGLHASSFLLRDITTTNNFNFTGSTTGAAGLYVEDSAGNYKFQLYGTGSEYGFLQAKWGAWDIRKVVNGDLYVRTSGTDRKVWHEANDGSGSGLDADLLDGVQGSSYLRSDTSDTFTSLSGTSLTLGSGVTMQESTDRADLLQITSSTSGWAGIQIRNSSNEGRWSFMTDGITSGFYDDENGDWTVQMDENGGVRLYYNSSERLNTNSGGVTVTGTCTATNFNTTSDATIKTNIRTITGSLDLVKAMRGVRFDWLWNAKPEVGVIAQEVEEVIPELVSTDENGFKSVKYGNIVAVLIEAVKEQQEQIDALKSQLNS
jgi:hypothetical protein